ncbi:hypothetical protein, partial [Clavibacter michiganensis]|uniref:hypothetical protein n=1 Tax=Clavibacter michiganensis TaxID=28447 RepID=UPI00292DC442
LTMNTSATTLPAGTTPAGPSFAPIAEAAVAPRTRLRITRRGRLVLTALDAAPLALGAGLVALNGGAAVASKDASGTTFEYVTVSSGQSLWDLAEEIAPSADPRDVIASVVDLNRLPSSDVAAGQQLAVPTEYAHCSSGDAAWGVARTAVRRRAPGGGRERGGWRGTDR